MQSLFALSFLPMASFSLWVLLLLHLFLPSVSMFATIPGLVRTITRHPFKLRSPNLDWRCKTPWLRSLLFFYPRPVLAFGYCRCLRLCVCVCLSVCQSLACPRDNSGPDQARIAKFGPKMQKTLVKVPIVLGGQLTLTFKVKFNFKVRIHPILSLSGP